jgi:hypothetical protein
VEEFGQFRYTGHDQRHVRVSGGHRCVQLCQLVERFADHLELVAQGADEPFLLCLFTACSRLRQHHDDTADPLADSASTSLKAPQ